jgi:hypothetical protein
MCRDSSKYNDLRCNKSDGVKQDFQYLVFEKFLRHSILKGMLPLYLMDTSIAKQNHVR